MHLSIQRRSQEARWPSGRASDSGARGRGFDPHSGRRVVSLSKLHLPPKSTGQNQGSGGSVPTRLKYCLLAKTKDVRFCRGSNESFSSLVNDVFFITKITLMLSKFHVESSIKPVPFEQPYVRWCVLGSLRPRVNTFR